MSYSVLVTGGLGYLGGRISSHLNEAGYDVRIATRNATLPIISPISGQVIKIDFDDADSLRAACDGVDCVVHLAAANEIDSARDPVQALQVNSIGTLRLVQAAEHCRVKRIIYFSTAHVYGSPLQGRITEETHPKPRHPYSYSHKVAEDIIMSKASAFEAVACFRLSNGFGAPARFDVSRWTLLMNDLCRQAVFEGSITLRSNGLVERDFITLTDISRAVEHFLKLDSVSWGDGIFNLGSGGTRSILTMAELVQNRFQILMGRKLPINLEKPSEPTGARPLQFCIEKILDTGFQLLNPCEEEVDATLKICFEQMRR